MAIKFFRLMDLLNRNGISKGELQEAIGSSSATVAKLSNNEYVALEVIDKIANYLTIKLDRVVTIDQILEFIPDEPIEIDTSGQ